jgi:hypothetical protein
MKHSHNNTYESIGQIAIDLFNKGEKMTFDSLKSALLAKNISFSSENNRGIAQSVKASYYYFGRLDKHSVSKAIAETITKKDGSYAYNTKK